jgi:hypothetical protein
LPQPLRRGGRNKACIESCYLRHNARITP